jgi:hypothetical protein
MTTTPADLKVLVIGNSHIVCLEAAAKAPPPGLLLKLLQLRNPPQKRALREWRNRRDPMPDALAEPLADETLDAVVLAPLGNAYNYFGMARHPEPFDFVLPGTQEAVETKTRIVSYGMVRLALRDAMKAQIILWNLFLKEITGPAYLMMPPPPVPEPVVRARPGPFAEPIASYGMSPLEFRVKVWHLQRSITLEAAQRHGIEVVDVPRHTIAPDGTLAPAFVRGDSTHGNAEFGAQMAVEISRRVRDDLRAA